MHRPLLVAPPDIDPVQLLGEVVGLDAAFGEQAADSDRDVLHPPGRIDARRHGEGQIGAADLPGVPLAATKKRDNAGGAPALPDAPQSVLHQNPVVPVQRHHVGHRAQRHQIKEPGHVRHLDAEPGEPSLPLQVLAQGQHHVEHHPDAGEGRAGETVGRAVRVDDAVGLRQLVSRQVVVGDQHPDAAPARLRDRFLARHPVVDRHDQGGVALFHLLHQLRAKPVAVAEAIRHQVIHVPVAHRVQAAHRDGHARRAVRVVIADQKNAPVLAHHGVQQLRRLDAGGEFADRMQSLQ